MFARKICVTFLILAISSLAAQAAPTFPQFPDVCGNNGGQVKTITQTVTVTAASSAQTSSDVAGGHKSVGSNNNSGIDNNSSGSSAGTGSSGNGSNGNNSSGGSGNNSSGGSGNNSSGGSVNNNNGGGGSNNRGSNNGGESNSTDGRIQSSLTLDPRVIATGFENDGQDVPVDGQVASLTSSNNFINFCLTVPQLPITNGKQITNGSCNPAPIGLIPAVENMPSSKFSSPPNFGAVKTNTAFTIKMQIQNMQTGFFVNAQENYFAAPQQINSQGQIQGHSHVVIERLNSIDQTVTTNPQNFAFFKGLNDAAVNGLLTADVTNGLPAGVYKLSSINSAANHQPVIVPIAQHGSLDDAIYFFVTDDGKPPAGAPFSDNSSGSTASSITSLTSSLAVGSSTAIPSASATGKGIKSIAQPTTATSSGSEQSTATSSGNEQSTTIAAASHKASASVGPTTATATGKVAGAPTAPAPAPATSSSQGNDSGNDSKDNSKDSSKDTSSDKEDNANEKN